MSKYQYDNKHLPFGHSRAINDEEVLQYINSLSFNITDILSSHKVVLDFCNEYLDWIKSNTLHKISGLDDFKYVVFSQGTSEGFDKFYLKHRTRRFRCFKNEYLYHKLAWRDSYDWCFIEDDSLRANDALIISMPFADTGCEHPSMRKLLNQATELNVPVLIDCAYFSISEGLNFNFDYPCITDVTFSLSKTFPVAHARIGIRLTREDCDDLLFVYDKAEYTNRLGPALGLELIRKFSPEFIINKYKTKQEEICKHLKVCPSNTVLFGLADVNDYKEYNRGGNTNRLGLHKFLNKDLDFLKGVLNGSSIKQ